MKKWIDALLERLYLPEILKGMTHTFRHMFGKRFTAQYPEQPHKIQPGYRGLHKLTKDDKGRVKCVACFLCETNCPAYAINIKSEEAPWPDRDRSPKVFEVDLLRCIYCGYCEEACPVDAIVLTEKIPPVFTTREEFIYNKEKLLANDA